MSRRTNSPIWSTFEDQITADLFKRGLSDREISAALPGRTIPSVQTRRLKLGLVRANPIYVDPHISIRRAIAERDARLAIPRSLTAEIFNDPHPGWSALDRR